MTAPTPPTRPVVPRRLVLPGDPHSMNWLREDFPYAEVRLAPPLHAPEGEPRLSAQVENTEADGQLHTRITLTNHTDRPVFTATGDVAITLPLQDRYDDAALCGTQRCNVHLFCGGTSSYVLARRMGGDPPHLGLVLTEGSLAAYSIERDLSLRSNDRGCFLLHPAPLQLAAGESATLAWTIFPCTGPEDFREQTLARTAFLDASWDRYVLQRGEDARLTVRTSADGAIELRDRTDGRAGGGWRPLDRPADDHPADDDSADGQCSSDDRPAVVPSPRPGADDSDAARRTVQATFTADEPGEHEIEVRVGDRTARTRLLVKEPLDVLLARRVAFIAAHQQYRGPIPGLRGALLAYDTQEHHQVYDRVDDYNAGRERVGMGVLLAEYLRAVDDDVLAEDPSGAVGTGSALAVGGESDPGGASRSALSRVRDALDAFVVFVRRELVDETTGEVFNDVGRDASRHRLYNAPWLARLFVALYRLDGHVPDVLLAARITERYYAEGGAGFYPIDLPALDLCTALDAAASDASAPSGARSPAGVRESVADEGDRALRARAREAAQRVRELFVGHARALADRGTEYPRSEVNYEQSIVAPAADILLQVHLLTGDPALLTAAHEQVRVLEQFQGIQPDHHLHEVAIRHWDGYWFGARQMYGDTLPHYWSGLTGNVFALYARATGDGSWARRAEASIRGVLPMIHDDGTATAAHVFPLSVNGQRAAFDDPLANDQDWALVFALRMRRGA